MRRRAHACVVEDRLGGGGTIAVYAEGASVRVVREG